MTVTWFDGPFEDFIAASARSRAGGRMSQHVLGGTAVDINLPRALAQTRLLLLVRGSVGDVEVDVTCTGRFVDRVERRDGRWGIVKRNAVYEKSRIDTVAPGARLQLDQQLLDSFPRGYCHLAYLQAQSGVQTAGDLPTGSGPALEALLSGGYAWLNGS